MDTNSLMQLLAKGIDKVINSLPGSPRNGFVLLVFPFDGPEGQRVNYVSNANREDITAALKEVAGRFEGRSHDAPKTMN